MDYKKNIFNMKVNVKLNNIFHDIIEDIPIYQNQSTEIALIKKDQIISYENFCVILYKCVLEYVPKQNENPLYKAIIMLPRFKKNIQRIVVNKEIIELQNAILNTYFYLPGDKNIKEKVNELKLQIDELVKEGNYQILDVLLERFEDRIRDGFLADMNRLSLMLEKRK